MKKFIPHIITVILCVVIYGNISNNIPTQYDDNIYPLNEVIQNDNIPSGEKLNRIFTEPLGFGYAPLVFVSYLIEAEMWGKTDYSKWYIDNLLLFILFCLVAISVFKRLRFEGIYLYLAIIIFLFNPLKTESVAWLTERKDLLFGLFYLLAFRFYIDYRNKGDKKHLLLTIVMFVFSLLSKIQAVSFPLTIFIYELYIRENGFKLSIKRTWYFFILSAGIGLLGIYFLSELQVFNEYDIPLGKRIFLGLGSFGIYSIKTFIPYKLSPLYSYPTDIGLEYILGFIVAIGLIGLMILSLLKKRFLILFGLLFFTVNIMFLIQIISAGNTHLANRYTFIASMGLVIVLVSFIRDLKLNKNILWGISIGILGVYVFLSVQEVKKWRDTESLAIAILDHYPDNIRIENELLNYYYLANDQIKYQDVLKSITNKGNENYKTYFINGVNNKKLGNKKAYYQNLKKAYSLEKNNVELLKEYGNVLIENNKYQELINEFKPWIDQEKTKDEMVFIGLAQTYYYDLGDFNNARKYTNLGLSIHPKSQRLNTINQNLIQSGY